MTNENRKCPNCDYYQQHEGSQEGICCMKPPQVVTAINAKGIGAPITEWPTVETDDWCGEFTESQESTTRTDAQTVGGAVR